MVLAFFISKRKNFGDKSIRPNSSPSTAMPCSSCFFKSSYPLPHPLRIDGYLKAIDEGKVDEYHKCHGR